MKEGGKEVVPPVTLKHRSNFYYEGSKAYEGRYSVPSKPYYLRTSKVSTYEGVKRCRSDLDHTTHTPLFIRCIKHIKHGVVIKA